MIGPKLQTRQVELVQLFTDRGHMHRGREPACNNRMNVRAPPAEHLVRCLTGSFDDQLAQFRLLRVCQPGRAARA